jgi:adenylate kinase
MNRFLNQVPHNRFVRQWFYDKASKAVRDAVVLCSEGKINHRMKVISKFPETNPTMDSYRIGTILELVRSIAITLAEENLRVRVCVQGSMGVGIFTGIPKQLSGVARLLQAMDWQSGPGEINEGMVGEYIRFGEVGPQHVLNEIKTTNTNTNDNENSSNNNDQMIQQYQDDVFIIIAPQSMVGVDCSIIPFLQEMTIAAGDRPVILINPDLTDKISSDGQQSVRGRQQRIDFDNSFQTIFHFQNIYISGTSYFPILGATTKLHPVNEPWIAHQRRDFIDGDEVYIPGTLFT